MFRVSSTRRVRRVSTAAMGPPFRPPLLLAVKRNEAGSPSDEDGGNPTGPSALWMRRRTGTSAGPPIPRYEARSRIDRDSADESCCRIGWQEVVHRDRASPLVPVDPLPTVVPAALVHTISEAVPPGTCESTETDTLVSGVLPKLTVASLRHRKSRQLSPRRSRWHRRRHSRAVRTR